MTFNPPYEVKSMGHITATFNLKATPENVRQLSEWLKQKGWRGSLILNFPGNGGIGQIQFAETPKVLREEK